MEENQEKQEKQEKRQFNVQIPVDTYDDIVNVANQFGSQAKAIQAIVAQFKLSQLDTQYPSRADDIASFRSHLDALREIFTHTLALNDDMRETIRNEFQAQQERDARTIQYAQDKIASLQSEIATLRSEKADADAHADASQKLQKEAESQLAEAIQRERDAVDRADKQQALADQRASDISGYINAFSEKQKELDAVKDDLAQLDELKRKVELLESTLETERRNATENLAKAEKRAEDLDAKRQATEIALAEAKAETRHAVEMAVYKTETEWKVKVDALQAELDKAKKSSSKKTPTSNTSN